MPVSTAIAVIGIGGGIAVLFGVLRMWRRSVASRSWPEAPGLIVFAAVKRGTNRGTGVADVHYAYTVDGREYQGTRIGQGSALSGSEAAAMAVVERYPVGTIVPVRYDPESPDYSVLETGLAWGTWNLVFTGLFFIAVGILAWQSAAP